MQNLKFGQYKYNVPQEYLYNQSNAFLKIVFILLYIITLFIIYTVLINITESVYILLGILVFTGILFLKRLSNPNNKILITDRCVIIGEKVIYYNNLARASINHNDSSIFDIVTKNRKHYVIETDRFPTNARKSWKIEKNKKNKFEKITNKILENIAKCAPEVLSKKEL